MDPHYPADAKIRREQIERAIRHVFLCLGPDCCDPSDGAALWQILKEECARLSVPVLRTKAACLRICTAGPWLVVYPEGIWYGRLDATRLCRILKEHVEQGRPVREWIAAERSTG